MTSEKKNLNNNEQEKVNGGLDTNDIFDDNGCVKDILKPTDVVLNPATVIPDLITPTKAIKGNE